MYKLNYFRILTFTFFMSTAYSDVKFNSLTERLVLDLIKVKFKTNVVGSELLVRFPLCKLASIAGGDTKAELMTVLGYKDEIALRSCYTRLREAINKMLISDLSLASRLYVNYTGEIDPTFINNSTEQFGVRVEKVGFNYPNAAISYINNVVSTITFKRITDIVDANDINKDTKMISIAGANFKGTWEFPFDYRLTKLTQFHHMEGNISKIPMMTKMEMFPYIATADGQAVSLRFGSWRASITFVLPNTTKEFPYLLQKIAGQKSYVNTLVKHMKFTPMKVIIPRFQIKTFVDWSGFLQELGVYSIFNANYSDLAGMLKKESRNKQVALSKIKQKVFIQIDEMGSARFKIDPVKEIIRGRPQLPLDLNVPNFIADKPFYFEVAWDFENSRYEMFQGAYYGPEP